jgi:tetratricopeptide (TPR) repeat protein
MMKRLDLVAGARQWGSRPTCCALALALLASWAAPSAALADDPPPSSTSTAAPAAGEAAPVAPPPVITATVAAPQGEAAARAYAEAGRAFYDAGKYLEAIAEFQKAYALVASPALAYNIARSHERLSVWQDAIKWYEVFVAGSTDPRDKAETLDKIEILKRKLGPDAQGPEARYEARIQAGKSAYSKGDYEGAIEEFKAAFDLKATPGALFNIARSYEKMGRYEEAIDFLRQYLDLDKNASDRADVEENIRRLQKSIRERFQELSVSSDPPGAEIYLDDRNSGLQGQTNFRFKVTPGPHTLFIDLNGYEPIKRDFVMPDDKPLALDFKMKKLENVGFLDIAVDREGARIFVDGAIVGLSPYRQKKAVEAGSHQIQVELAGFERHTQTVEVVREQTATVQVVMAEYKAPVGDDTLSAWGRNLMLIGIVGGGLGFGGPFAYQKLVLRRSLYDQLGPERADGNPFYTGPLGDADPNRRANGELETLKTIQLVSLIAGGTFTAAGLGFYIYKWVRTVPPSPTSAALDGEGSRPWVRVTGFGVVPSAEGASLGLSGSF